MRAVQVRHGMDWAVFCCEVAAMTFERLERFVDGVFADLYPQGAVLSRFLGPIGCPGFERSVSAVCAGQILSLALRTWNAPSDLYERDCLLGSIC